MRFTKKRINYTNWQEKDKLSQALRWDELKNGQLKPVEKNLLSNSRTRTYKL